jgi:hypothetical protein
MTSRAKAEARKAKAIERNRHGVRSTHFECARDELPQLVDAHFFGNPEKPGWVEMYVNPKGREAINATFPKAHIDWKKLNHDGMFDSVKGSPWLEMETFEIHLPSAIEVMTLDECKLPSWFTYNELDKANQTQLAFVLACSARFNGGARCSWDDNGQVNIITPSVN